MIWVATRAGGPLLEPAATYPQTSHRATCTLTGLDSVISRIHRRLAQQQPTTVTEASGSPEPAEKRQDPRATVARRHCNGPALTRSARC